MKTLNCIVVYNKEKTHLLFCKRMKEPYKGLYNFVGGKVEPGESSEDAAYRELEEETGITREDLCLLHFMDLNYYVQDFKLELFMGVLNKEKEVIPEANPLIWLTKEENFADSSRFAGDQNIAHIVNISRKCLTE